MVTRIPTYNPDPLNASPTTAAMFCEVMGPGPVPGIGAGPTVRAGVAAYTTAGAGLLEKKTSYGKGPVPVECVTSRLPFTSTVSTIDELIALGRSTPIGIIESWTGGVPGGTPRSGA